MTATTSRIIHYGNELFHTIEQSDLNKSFKVTYWDLWIAILLLNQFDNNWEEMIDYLRLKQKGNQRLRNAFESLSNHIIMLRQKLTKNGLIHTDLIVDTDKSILKKHETKAKRKILEMHFQPKEMSSWMINTPRKCTEMRAFYGHWDRFPVNPETYAVSFKKLYKSGFYTKKQSHTLERKLSNYIEKHERRASISELFALYRAIMTVITIKMDMVDDSYGQIGGLFEEIFVKYYLLERASFEMLRKDFFLDLIELMLWEDYGGTYEQEEGFFKINLHKSKTLFDFGVKGCEMAYF